MIHWHCKGCNDFGKQSLDFNEVIKRRKNEDLFTLIMSMIKHDCKDKDLGIRAGLERAYVGNKETKG